MLVGYGHLATDPDECITNAYIQNARVVVENAFGRLKSRFESLKCVKCETELAPHWIHACVILHNFIERREGVWSTGPIPPPPPNHGVCPASNNPEHGDGQKLLAEINAYIKRLRAARARGADI